MTRVYSADGRIIGYIEGGIFFKPVIPEIHRLRKPPGWATDADSFDKEVVPNCHTITLIDEQNKKSYSASVEVFQAHKIELNRGFGRQYALTTKWWRETSAMQKSML